MANGYTTINLPIPLVEELKLWRCAFTAAYGKNVSYAFMIRSMLDCLEDTEPAVAAEMDRILESHPEFADKLGNRLRPAAI